MCGFTIVKCIIYLACNASTGMFKDPVCRMMVDEKTAKHVSEAGGKKVYLCSAACKTQFDSNPQKYGY